MAYLIIGRGSKQDGDVFYAVCHSITRARELREEAAREDLAREYFWFPVPEDDN